MSIKLFSEKLDRASFRFVGKLVLGVFAWNLSADVQLCTIDMDCLGGYPCLPILEPALGLSRFFLWAKKEIHRRW